MLENIFKKNKNLSSFDVEEIKPIFESFGVNVENIGFPFIGYRNLSPLEKYFISFEDLEIKPVKNNNEISAIITGKYISQSQISGKDKQGEYYTEVSIEYKFEIKDGKLNLGKKSLKVL